MAATYGLYSMTVHAVFVVGHRWAEAVQYFTLYDLLQQRCLPLCYYNDKVAECRLKPYPTLYETFMIQDGPRWRPPAVNESCCARPQLAATLQRIAEEGPDAVYTGQAGQVTHGFTLTLRFTVLPHICHITSHYITLHCIALHCIALHYTMFHFVLLCYIVLHCNLLHFEKCERH